MSKREAVQGEGWICRSLRWELPSMSASKQISAGAEILGAKPESDRSGWWKRAAELWLSHTTLE